MKKVLVVIVMVVLTACTRKSFRNETALIVFLHSEVFTRAGFPDENLISDCNILVFNPYGDLEERVYTPARSLRAPDGRLTYNVRLLRDVPYTVVCAFNLGYALPAMTLEEARAYRYHLAHPEEYGRGLPMVAVREDVVPGDSIHLRAKRLMARVDVDLRADNVPEDVLLKFTDVEVGGCPSSATLFPGSHAVDTFSRGFVHSFADAPMSLYVLENLDEGMSLDIRAEYQGPDLHTDPGWRIHYRAALPPLERNCVYPITIKVTP